MVICLYHSNASFCIPLALLSLVGQMSSRIDALENAIHDLISGDIARPSPPSTPGLLPEGGVQRQGSMSDSGL
jgi:hypothetical protein